jgi:hypothetical protein
MSVVLPVPDFTMAAAMQQQLQLQQQPRPPLRRAIYVHVSDLTSAYNIDHAKLEQELARVKGMQESATATNNTKGGGDATAVEDGAAAEVQPQPAVLVDSDASVASLPQKRLQPPRGGYNLCV